MAAAESSAPQERSDSHVPTFSARHPMIPRLYVLPWRQDVKNQRLLMKTAALAGIPVDPLQESLCLCGRERLCHSQDSAPSSASSSAPLSQTGLMAHRSSHLSRFNSSVVTTRRLYLPRPRPSPSPQTQTQSLSLDPDPVPLPRPKPSPSP